jgi:hypothetical protein
MIRKQAMDDLVRAKVQLILARDRGLIKEIHFDALMKERVRVNQERKGKAARNELIYGPIEYGKGDYYDYLLSNLAIRLKEAMAQSDFKLSETKLAEKYARHREQYRRLDRCRYAVLRIKARIGQSESEKARTALVAVRAGGGAESDLAVSAENLRSTFGDRVELTELAIDENALRSGGEESEIRRCWEEIGDQKVGEVSPVLAFQGAWAALRCLERNAMGYWSLEKVKSIIQDRYTEEHFEKLSNPRRGMPRSMWIGALWRPFNHRKGIES